MVSVITKPESVGSKAIKQRIDAYGRYAVISAMAEKNNIKLKKLNFKLFEFYKGYTCNEFEKTEIFNVYSRLLIPFE